MINKLSSVFAKLELTLKIIYAIYARFPVEYVLNIHVALVKFHFS